MAGGDGRSFGTWIFETHLSFELCLTCELWHLGLVGRDCHGPAVQGAVPRVQNGALAPVDVSTMTDEVHQEQMILLVRCVHNPVMPYAEFVESL